jgi:predicted dehydrogenase
LIHVGIIGFGFVSKTFHVPLISATEGYRISAVASSRAAEVKAALPEVDVVEDPKDLATHDDIDLLVVASPNQTHAPLAEFALRAGRNVVVEKPFTISTAEARHLTNVANETGKLLSVFHNRRWDTDFLTVRDALRSHVTGRVASFESRINRYRPQVRDRWRENPGPGAGLLYDLAPHLIDQTILLFGIPDSVQATVAMQRVGAKTDDFFHLTLRYGEMIATLQASSLVSGGTARFSVHGEKASLIKQKMDIQEDQLRAGMTPGSSQWGIDPDDALLYEGDESRQIKSSRGDQRGFYFAVRDALSGNGRNPVPGLQGSTIIAFIEAAIRSSAEGRRIVPDLTDDERNAWPAPIETRRGTH